MWKSDGRGQLSPARNRLILDTMAWPARQRQVEEDTHSFMTSVSMRLRGEDMVARAVQVREAVWVRERFRSGNRPREGEGMPQARTRLRAKMSRSAHGEADRGGVGERRSAIRSGAAAGGGRSR